MRKMLLAIGWNETMRRGWKTKSHEIRNLLPIYHVYCCPGGFRKKMFIFMKKRIAWLTEHLKILLNSWDTYAQKVKYILLCILSQCWFKVELQSSKPALGRCVMNVYSQQTGGVGTMLGWCWPIIYDAGPTSTQHWVKALVFAGWYIIWEHTTYPAVDKPPWQSWSASKRCLTQKFWWHFSHLKGISWNLSL